MQRLTNIRSFISLNIPSILLDVKRAFLKQYGLSMKVRLWWHSIQIFKVIYFPANISWIWDKSLKIDMWYNIYKMHFIVVILNDPSIWAKKMNSITIQKLIKQFYYKRKIYSTALFKILIVKQKMLWSNNLAWISYFKIYYNCLVAYPEIE